MNEDGFFRQDSPFLNHPLLTTERTLAEIDFIEQTLNLRTGAQLLDVGCGYGRHSVELARRGYRIVGIDSSEAMIDAAKANAEDANVIVDFRQEKAQDFESHERFDAAICLFTSLGQVDEQGDNLGLVKQVWSALKVGGWFVVEVPQHAVAVQQLRPNDRFGNEDSYAVVTRDYDQKSHILTEEFRVVKFGNEQHFTLRYRLLSSAELAALLEGAGFHIEKSLGDYAGSALTTDDPMMIFIARKEG